MQCLKCDKRAVIELQHGGLCKNHFLNYFEHKVFKTINKYRLLKREDKIVVAASGGKDSLTVLHLVREYCRKYQMKCEISALAVDEGIADYREKTLIDLKAFCEEKKVELKVVSNKEEFGSTLDEAQTKTEGKKPCNTCGVWRRYLLNKYAREQKATKVVTGHNLDDEAQAIMMNMFKANTKLSANLGPVSGIAGDALFVQRVKPLYFCSEKETRLYTLLKGWKVEFTECPYAAVGFRAHVRDMFNDFEAQYAGTKQAVVRSFLSMLPLLKEQAQMGKTGNVKACEKCGEPSNKMKCNACEIKEIVNG